MLYKPNPGLPRQIEAETKFFQAGPNLAKQIKENQRKSPWSCFDFLVRIEPFQGVTPTPKGLFSLPLGRTKYHALNGDPNAHAPSGALVQSCRLIAGVTIQES